MKLYHLILLFCVFCNFFSYNVLVFLLGDATMWAYDYASKEQILQTEIELAIIFIIMIMMSIIVRIPNNKHQSFVNDQLQYRKRSVFYRLILLIFIIFVAYTLIGTNWSFSNEERGIGQSELENRGTLIQGIMHEFYLPLLLYLLLIGFFKKKKYYLFIALIVLIINGIAGGGRDAIVYATIVFLLYYVYLKRMPLKYFMFLFIIFFVVMGLSASDRFNTGSPILNLVVKIVGANTNSSYLSMVKWAVHHGYELSPFTFSLHFISLLIPSFVFINFFHLLSYPRASLLFDTIFNVNPDNGMGFMMLADFYWSFGYLGYFLYLLLFYFVLHFFKNNIYSRNPVNVTMAIMTILYFSNQRVDFGSFLKPFVYTYVFLSILEYFRKKEINKFI